MTARSRPALHALQTDSVLASVAPLALPGAPLAPADQLSAGPLPPLAKIPAGVHLPHAGRAADLARLAKTEQRKRPAKSMAKSHIGPRSGHK
ncbi:MAG: hypothetical protein AB7I79_00640 [Rhizobiaceae bacterium]